MFDTDLAISFPRVKVDIRLCGIASFHHAQSNNSASFIGSTVALQTSVRIAYMRGRCRMTVVVLLFLVPKTVRQ